MKIHLTAAALAVSGACRNTGLGLLMCVSLNANAACSRTISVPISPIGLSVVVNGNSFSGVYPDILRAASARDGCKFEFSVVPRTRLDALFAAGKADLLIPASKSARRDEHGLFVPLVFSRATVISVASNRPAIRSAQDLLQRRELKVALVRGFDFGDGYQKLVKELTRQGRVYLDTDVVSVARLMQSGHADVTIMAPSILAGAIQDEPRTPGLLEKLRFEPIEELPWSDSGAYISKTSLNDADRAALRDLLERSAKSGAVWSAFQRYYPAGALAGSIQPR
ncbi:transporter substrate-binding domain-containing protein [Undibacterium sp.]|uniref:substrate-binding periplasmic protein n=1 Tax=Undibacterium sp. TaxID=1914977 RepID=UPI002BEDA01B|nr:transporter substrate-binding domain-containing protein [Undibacterium sp.]HTD05157.1 transporter substrate-binding domain-containing protein [Undibacterium sp.]